MLATSQLPHISYGVQQKNVRLSLSMHSEHSILFRLLTVWNAVSHCKDMVICCLHLPIADIITSVTFRFRVFLAKQLAVVRPLELIEVKLF
jgi:hypothetical protein